MAGITPYSVLVASGIAGNICEFGDSVPSRQRLFDAHLGEGSQRDGTVGAQTESQDQNHGSAKRYNFNTIAALVFIAFAIFLFFITPYQVEKPAIVFGQSLNALDPTLFPRIVALFLLGLGIWLFFESVHIRERNGFRDLDREAYINVGVSLGTFTLYALLMEPLGFILSSVLLVGGLSIFYGVRNFLLVGAVSIVIPVSIYFVFTRLLQVFLPALPEF